MYNYRDLPIVIWVVAFQALLLHSMCIWFSIYSIVSGGQNSLSSGKRRLSGGLDQPPATSVDKNTEYGVEEKHGSIIMKIAPIQCANICTYPQKL